MQLMTRGEVRRKFNLEGNGCTDCLGMSKEGTWSQLTSTDHRISCCVLHMLRPGPNGQGSRRATKLAPSNFSAREEPSWHELRGASAACLDIRSLHGFAGYATARSAAHPISLGSAYSAPRRGALSAHELQPCVRNAGS